MSILPTWPIAAACLATGALLGAGADHLWMNGKVNRLTETLTAERAAHAEELRKREVQRGVDERAARSAEHQMAEAIGIVEQEKINEIDRIRRAAADSIARLQNRPDRQPASTGGTGPQTPACQGATGAELSRPDAIFLDGEATRADEHRAALSACYAAYDSIGR